MLLGKFEGLLNMTNQAVKEKTLSPQEVRAILNTDNKEIVELCKRASIMPRKNSKGMTYFSYEEVKNLRKIQALKANSAQRSASGTSVVTTAQPTAIQNILTSLKTMESTLSDRIAKVIDEKLEGMDDVVLELVRCKTENENLKNKVNELNKENFRLKNILNSFKPLVAGFYIKKEEENNVLL